MPAKLKAVSEDTEKVVTKKRTKAAKPTVEATSENEEAIVVAEDGEDVAATQEESVSSVMPDVEPEPDAEPESEEIDDVTGEDPAEDEETDGADDADLVDSSESDTSDEEEESEDATPDAEDNAATEESENNSAESAEVLEEDEMELFEEVLGDLLADSQTYRKRHVSGASREERREVYEDDNHVVRVAGRKAKTESDKLRDEVNTLKSAATSVPPTQLMGVVDSFRKTDNGMWIVEMQLKDSEGRVPIYVSLNQFHVIEGAEYENDAVISNDLTSRIGAEVSFIPYLVRETKKKGAKTFAIASCVYAMAQEANRNFVRITADGRPKCVNGMKLPAVVVGVRRDKVRVNVMGAEATIDSPELSWTALDSVEKEFEVGDEFYVKVSDIHETKYTTGNITYNIVKLKASKRQAESNPAKKYINDFTEGEVCRGVVKAFTPNGLMFVRVKNKMDCLCHASASGVNLRGDKVSVRIKEVNRKDCTLYGTIHRG
jgi:hypothetical protein